MKEAAELFKILSVDKRIEIIELLKKESMSVNAIADTLKITQSAVSQHLQVLKAAVFPVELSYLLPDRCYTICII